MTEDKKKDEIPSLKCPECKTELVLVNGKPPEECAKCGFVLDGYDLFKRWLKAAKEEETPEPKPEPKAEPKSRNPLANLRKRKK